MTKGADSPLQHLKEKRLHMTDCYENSSQHLLAALHRLDVLLELRLLKFRRQHRVTEPREFRGLYIADEEIAAALQYPTAAAGQQPMGAQEAPLEQELHDRLTELSQQIYQKTAASLHKGKVLYLPLLAKIFELSAFEIDTLLICLAPEVDLRYEKVYAYLQDDVTRKRPTVRLILDLLCQSFAEEVAARAYFSSQASLFRYQLLHWEATHEKASSFLACPLQADERIVQFLLGSSQVDTRLTAYAKTLEPKAVGTPLAQDAPWHQRLLSLTQEYLEKKFPDTGKLVFFLQNPCPVERRTAAEAVCREIGLPLLLIDLEALLNANLPMDTALSLAFREGLLQPAIVYVEHCDRLLADDEKSVSGRTLLFKAIEELSWLTFLAGSSAWQPPEDFIQRHIFIGMELPVATFGKRQQLWESCLGDEQSAIAPSDLVALANKFRFHTGQIQAAMHSARNLAIARHGVECQITINDLYEACRLLSNQKLSYHAQKIQPKFTWDDLIVPDDRQRQLREICQWVQYHHVVFGDWGFERKLSLGKGLNILFVGLSGTGKTMAAEILAGELGLELYRIDLSVVVSKYIGETEKNLSLIFAEAATSNAILFFDEADALFGKRSEVKDAHDRYANIEINYLLMKMEEHEGIVILATNLQKNLDEAFLRRMHFVVEFPFPDEEHRRRIWHSVFPSAAPLGSDIDVAFLARRLKLSGGNIKNIALNAAFLAADNAGTIGMEHVILATKREFQKLGRLCVKSDFEQYYDLVKDPEDII
jgi:ATP-dependent 26S proteasome regulatory subunit